MSDIKELKDEELEKVNGGLVSVSELCASCQQFLPKNVNGSKYKTNCQRYNTTVNMCNVMANAGYEIVD